MDAVIEWLALVVFLVALTFDDSHLNLLMIKCAVYKEAWLSLMVSKWRQLSLN